MTTNHSALARSVADTEKKKLNCATLAIEPFHSQHMFATCKATCSANKSLLMACYLRAPVTLSVTRRLGDRHAISDALPILLSHCANAVVAPAPLALMTCAGTP